jgi:DNA-directed RNA polymerase specialized sigma subunit
MTFDEARLIVEAKMMIWGTLRHTKKPSATISSAYQPNSSIAGGEKQSQQEVWVTRHDRDLDIVIEVEKAMERLNEDQKKLIHLRYGQHLPWKKVAELMFISEREAFLLKDRSVCCLAYGLGMLDESVQ